MSKGIEELKLRDSNYFKYLKASGEELLRNKEIIFKGTKLKEKKGLLGLFSKY